MIQLEPVHLDRLIITYDKCLIPEEWLGTLQPTKQAGWLYNDPTLITGNFFET